MIPMERKFGITELQQMHCDTLENRKLLLNYENNHNDYDYFHNVI